MSAPRAATPSRPRLTVVGRSLPMIGAEDKVAGRALYVSDLRLPHMLHAKVLRSPCPHARIVHVDTERARRLAGVKAVLTGADTPRPIGAIPAHRDEHILAVDKVRHAGEEVAAVAAVDEDTALDALELIRVEYEELPAVFDPEEALQPGAPLVHDGGNLVREIRIDRGDVDAGFAEAVAVHEATYQTQPQYHAPMEPTGALATADASGRLTVWAPVQSIHRNQLRLADALGLPTSKVRVIQPHIGGSFGGKLGEDSTHYITARLALACGRPVRLLNTRNEDFLGVRARTAARIRLRMGVARDGRITAKETWIHADNGAYCGLSPEVLLVTAARLDSLYRHRNVRTLARLVYTNNPPSGAFRGFGNPEMAFALESHLDVLAEMLDMDPIELRLRNTVQPGETTVHGWHIGSCELPRCFEETARRIAWTPRPARHHAAGAQVATRTGVRRRGVGIACAMHVSGARQAADWDGSNVVVKLTPDGRAVIICGEGDIGQGGPTALTQIAAETLGIPPEHITVTPADTETTPFCFGPMASRLTLVAGNAVIRAAEGARRQLLAIAGRLLEVSPDDLTIADGAIQVVGAPHRKVTIAQACSAHIFRRDGEDIFARGTYDAPSEVADRKTFLGNVSAAYSFAVQAVEVEVDTETGAIHVLRIVAADDVGTPVNPRAVEGQVHGAIAQGVGYALFEGFVLENGRLLNGNLADYTVPTASSIPTVETILVDGWEPNGPYGAKGGSEAPISPTAAAVANAIYDAVGVRITSLPITPEKILRALRERREERR